VQLRKAIRQERKRREEEKKRERISITGSILKRKRNEIDYICEVYSSNWLGYFIERHLQ
jgi:hypothetical protein